VALAFSHFSRPEVFGQYQYVNSMLGAVALFALPGMSVAIMRGSARGLDGTLWEGTRHRLRFSLLGSAVMLGLAGVFAARGQTSLARALIIVAALQPAVTSLDTYLAHLTGKRVFTAVALCEIVATLIPLVFLVVALAADGRLESAILAGMGGTALAHALFFAATRRRVANQRVDPEDVRYGRRVSGVYIIGTAHAHASSLIVGTLLGPVNLAVFAVSLVCAEVFRQAMVLLNTQLFPYLAAASEEDARALTRRSLAIGVPAVVVTGALGIALLPVVVPWLFTRRYVDSALYAQVLVGGMILSFWGNQYNNFMRARARVGAQYRLALSALVTELAATVALIGPLGLLGVAIAKGVTRLWYSAYAGWLIWRKV
jgi:O-antigen/teichoic acid export membrane protein